MDRLDVQLSQRDWDAGDCVAGSFKQRSANECLLLRLVDRLEVQLSQRDWDAGDCVAAALNSVQRQVSGEKSGCWRCQRGTGQEAWLPKTSSLTKRRQEERLQRDGVPALCSLVYADGGSS